MLSQRAHERLSSLPELARFYDCIPAPEKLRDWDTFCYLTPAFEKLLGGSFTTDFLNYELGQLAGNSEYVADVTSETEFPILNDGRLGISLKCIPAGKAASERLYSSAEHNAIGVVSDHSLELNHWRQRDPFPDTVLDRSKLLTDMGVRTVTTGSAVWLRAGYDIVQAVPARATVYFLQLFTPTVTSLRWAYDAALLAPVGAVAARVSSSRLQFAAKLLMHFKDGSSLPGLLSLVDHMDHFVRWQAIQAVVEIDFKLGVEILNKVAENDTHPHIRAAATRSLASLEEALSHA